MNIQSRGFTLVEMLVALVVFGLLTAAAMALLGQSLRQKDAFAQSTGVIQELQMARALMRGDFAQLAARPVRDAYGAPGRESFRGENTAAQPVLAFVRHGWDNAMGAEARSSLQYVEYVLEGKALVRRTRPYLDPTPDTPVSATTVLSGVETVAVSFLAAGKWSDTWITPPGGAAFPDAIAVTAAVPGLGDIRQAFLVAAP